MEEEKKSKSMNSSVNIEESTNDTDLFKDEAYFSFQKRRLIFLIIAFMSTSLVGLVWDLLGEEIFYDDFFCENGFHLVYFLF
jgi:hypothetical protein